MGSEREIFARLRNARRETQSDAPQSQNPQDAQTQTQTGPNIWMLVMLSTGEDMFANKQQQLQRAMQNPEAYEQEYAEKMATLRGYETEYEGKLDHIKKLYDTEESEIEKMRLDALRKKTEKEYEDLRIETLESLTVRSTGIAAFYLSDKVQRQMGKSAAENQTKFRAEILQGVGTKYFNPALMDPKTGKVKARAYLARVKSLITGAGENQNIDYVMQQLADTAPADRPKHIILNGHSRGASSCIELARKIYLAYGDDIKISMNISDPVPGPGRHSESKMVIPPNVDSLFITYTSAKSQVPYLSSTEKLFDPQDASEILFDPTKTTVSTMTFPVNHFLGGASYLDREHVERAISSLNTGLVEALADKEGDKKDFSLRFESNVLTDAERPSEEIRQGREFVVTTNPETNTNLPPSLKALHAQVQTTAYVGGTNLENYRGENRAFGSQAIEGLDDKVEIGRTVILSTLYRFGQLTQKFNADLSLHDNLRADPKYMQWKTTSQPELSKNLDSFDEKKQASVDKLKAESARLGSLDPEKKDKAIQKQIHALDRAAFVIDSLKKPSPASTASDYAQYYLKLEFLKADVKKDLKKSFLSQAIDFFTPKAKDQTRKLIDTEIKSLLHTEKRPQKELTSQTPKPR